MKQRLAVLAVLSVAALSSIGLAACGSSSSGKEGGTLNVTYASFPDYMDPQISYTAEGWTAMGQVYIPLLTYRGAEGKADGEDVIDADYKDVN